MRNIVRETDHITVPEWEAELKAKEAKLAEMEKGMFVLIPAHGVKTEVTGKN